MNLILFLFIFPIAVIIFSIALQKILKNPFLVSAIILAVFLIITFTVYGVGFLIAAFIYAIIALITAYIVSIFCRISNRTIEINFIDNNRRCYDNDLSCCNNLRTREGQCSSCNNINARSGNNRSISNCCDEDNYNIGCGTLRSGDPNTTACRTCACQRQFRNCLRRV
mgnify:CR=1 FL=1